MSKLFPRGTVMKETTHRYLLGLSWVLEYYTTNCAPAWEWFYDQCYSPTILAMYNELVAGPPADSARDVYRLSRPITPLVQLTAVIPPSQAAALLPPIGVKAQADPRIQHMFPTSFHVHTWLKSVAWECAPVLPPLSISLIAAVVQHHEQKHSQRLKSVRAGVKSDTPSVAV